MQYDVIDLATCRKAEVREFTEELAKVYEKVYDADVAVHVVDAPLDEDGDLDVAVGKAGFDPDKVLAVVLYCDRLYAVIE